MQARFKDMKEGGFFWASQREQLLENLPCIIRGSLEPPEQCHKIALNSFLDCYKV